jgi:hypothetical protein
LFQSPTLQQLIRLKYSITHKGKDCGKRRYMQYRDRQIANYNRVQKGANREWRCELVDNLHNQ